MIIWNGGSGRISDFYGLQLLQLLPYLESSHAKARCAYFLEIQRTFVHHVEKPNTIDKRCNMTG